MKLTTIIGAAIAAAGLAACGSAATPTARPTVTPTVAPTTAPTATPTATPTPAPSPVPTPTPKPQLSVYVTTTCAVPGTAQGASVTFHNEVIGDWLLFGYSDGPQYQFNRNPYTFGPVDVGTWPWKIWNDAKAAFIAHGTVTIPACPGTTIR
jgi:hypothetical protein